MLISNTHKFIFLKTVKTAGTTVEIFFERFCVPPGTLSTHRREESVSRYGIVGARPRLESSKWWSHMTAHELKNCIGNDTWNSYFKFSCIRNPFDASVSKFWFDNRNNKLEIQRNNFIEIRALSQ